MADLYSEKYAHALRKKIPYSTKKHLSTYLPISSTDNVLEIGVGNGV